MIKYKLNCLKCKKTFDSWFASSIQFEKLKKKNYLNCHFCNSKKIEKTLMAPNVLNSRDRAILIKNSVKKAQIKKKILEFQKFIEKNFENVGDDFTYKARSLHYGTKKSQKGIYGNATFKDLKDLHEEGIETQIFPWVKKKEN